MYILVSTSLLKQWLQNGYEFLTAHSLWIWSTMLFIVTAAIVGLIYVSRHARDMEMRWKQSLLLTKQLQPSNDLEQNMSDLLEQVSNIVDAPTYVIYLYDEVKKVFLLKAVRHRSEDFGKVEPSYSGLVEYKKEQYLPPLSLSFEQFPEKVGLEKAGEVTLLQIPIGEQQGMIRVGPLNDKINKSIERNLQDFSEMMKYALQQFINMEKVRNEAKVIVSTGEALYRINGIAMDSKVTIDFMLKKAAHVMNANGAFFGTLHNGEYTLTAVSGTDPVLLEGFDQGDLTSDLFFVESDVNDIRLITQDDDAFYQIPPYVAAIGAEAFAIVDVSELRGNRMSRVLVLWYNQTPNESEWKKTRESLSILRDSLREVLGDQETLKKFSGTYVNILKTLAKMQDSLHPFTVGYSDLMSRYSIVIGKEMGLPEEEIRDIALAAYLSNIGVIGIKADLVNKEGRYTDEEFEYMKLHAEVGASIVQSTLSNDKVASYVMHHHERMDGNGYPLGLVGNDIPVGARIIGVVQTFLALINGREHRDPLPFNKVFSTLEAAAGSQLDEKIIRTFITWFKNKQADPRFDGRSLGSCWEMCCTPSSICEHCPVYGRTDVNCWEIEGNNCQSHGKKCETCFVRTETITRKENVYS